MGYKKMSWLQQVLYVLVYKLGEFERRRQAILYGKPAPGESKYAGPKDNTDS